MSFGSRETDRDRFFLSFPALTSRVSGRSTPSSVGRCSLVRSSAVVVVVAAVAVVEEGGARSGSSRASAASEEEAIASFVFPFLLPLSELQIY